MSADLSREHAIAIEPFDPGKHDRAAFSSGVKRIDNFLKLSAKKQQEAGFTKLWVAVTPSSTQVLGFYAMNAHSIDVGVLPAKLAKHAPRHGAVPAAYLSMIGVTQQCQGQGLGRALLADALQKAAQAASQLGILAVILDVIEDGGDADAAKRQSFYEAMGFQPCPEQPRRMFITIASIVDALSPIEEG